MLLGEADFGCTDFPAISSAPSAPPGNALLGKVAVVCVFNQTHTIDAFQLVIRILTAVCCGLACTSGAHANLRRTFVDRDASSVLCVAPAGTLRRVTNRRRGRTVYNALACTCIALAAVHALHTIARIRRGRTIQVALAGKRVALAPIGAMNSVALTRTRLTSVSVTATWAVIRTTLFPTDALLVGLAVLLVADAAALDMRTVLVVLALTLTGLRLAAHAFFGALRLVTDAFVQLRAVVGRLAVTLAGDHRRFADLRRRTIAAFAGDVLSGGEFRADATTRHVARAILVRFARLLFADLRRTSDAVTVDAALVTATADDLVTAAVLELPALAGEILAGLGDTRRALFALLRVGAELVAATLGSLMRGSAAWNALAAGTAGVQGIAVKTTDAVLEIRALLVLSAIAFAGDHRHLAGAMLVLGVLLDADTPGDAVIAVACLLASPDANRCTAPLALFIGAVAAGAADAVTMGQVGRQRRIVDAERQIRRSGVVLVADQRVVFLAGTLSLGADAAALVGLPAFPTFTLLRLDNIVDGG